MKYLNMESHHHKNHKTAVLQGVELHLALFTTELDKNKNLNLLDIYPDKHEALSTTGQIKAGQMIRTISKVLDDESWCGPARLEKRLRAIDKHDFFYCKVCKSRPQQPAHSPSNFQSQKWIPA